MLERKRITNGKGERERWGGPSNMGTVGGGYQLSPSFDHEDLNLKRIRLGEFVSGTKEGLGVGLPFQCDVGNARAKTEAWGGGRIM